MKQIVSFQVKVTTSEFRALRALAQREYRDFRQQAGILIQAELERLGLLQLSEDLIEQPTNATDAEGGIASDEEGDHEPL